MPGRAAQPAAEGAFALHRQSRALLASGHDRSETGSRAQFVAIERLSREDRFMLWPDRRWPQVNGALLILDGRPLSDGAGRLQIDRARRLIESRLEHVPRFRQLLYVPPRRLGGPVWIDARLFEVSEHVAEVRVPDPAGEAELLAVVEELWCRRLDRSRPLWSMWFLTGLPEGRVALIIEIHHAIADGVAAIATVAGFLDTEPAAGPATGRPWTPAPAAGELFRDGLHERATGVRRSLSPLVHPARAFRAVTHVAQQSAGPVEARRPRAASR